MMTEQMTQALAIIGKLDPVSQSAATVTITDLDMARYHRMLFVIQVGSVGASGTVDAKLRESKTSGGTYQDISNKSITQITASNKIATIEVRADELDAGYEFVQLSLTVGTNAVLIAAVALGGEASHKPANANNIAGVTQQVA